MKKNLIITALSVIVTLLIGYIIGDRFHFTKTDKGNSKYIRQDDDKYKNNTKAESPRNTAIDFSDERTYQINEETFLTLFSDHTGMLNDDDNITLNWKIIEDKINGEMIRCIYIFRNRDTSDSAFIISEDGRIQRLWLGLNDFMMGTIGKVEGRISARIFCKAVKVSLKIHPDNWMKCKYKDGVNK